MTEKNFVRPKMSQMCLFFVVLINGLWRCPPIDVNARSRDCHATDALEL